MRIKLLIVGCIGFSLVGCSEASVDRGTIIQRSYVAAFDTIEYNWVCTSYDKYGNCALRVPIPYTLHHPDHWSIKVHGQDTKGKIKDQWKDVDKYGYDNCVVGARYPGCTYR